MDLRGKFIARKVSFHTIAFLAGAIEKQNTGGPQHIETMEIGWGFFDVDGYRMKILVDKLCNLIIGVRFGFQPNASTSSGSGAEIKQDGLVAGFCL
jgi:hypothetical protein